MYAMAVLLPGILLGALAWRGIQNDGARREKESRIRLQGTFDFFCQAMDSILVARMDDLTPGLKEDTVPAFPEFVRLAFHQAHQDDPELLHHDLLYIPDSLNPGVPGIGVFSAEFREASGLESAGRDLERSRMLFMAIARKTANPDEEINARLAAARISKKMNQPRQAIDEWSRIETRFPSDMINGKIPVKLIALTEKARNFRELGKEDSVSQVVNILFQTLLNPPTIYESAQYRFFKEQLETIYRGGDPMADSLRGVLSERQAYTDFFIRLILEKSPLFLERGDRQTITTGLHRFPFLYENQSYLFLTAESSGGDRYGMVLEMGTLARMATDGILEKADPAGDLSWSLQDPAGKTIVSSIRSDKNEFVNFSLPSEFPGWSLHIKENEMGWPDEWLSKGNGTYLLIFIFIALIMALGLVFTMNTLNQELKLNRLKTDFIANVSHELKSPLTSIRHLMDLLYLNRVKTAEQKQKYYATMIEQTEHLSYLVENILDFSRLEENRKKYRFQQADYAELLSQWIDQTEDHARLRQIRIIRQWEDQLPMLWIDPDAIQQVLFNLIDNAVKYSGDSKQIEVSVTVDHNEIKTTVSDWGIGIAKKDQDKVFDRFFRCEENLTRGIKGSGIGLTIVKRIVQDHDGSITVDSSPGQGSRFCFRLPVKPRKDHEENITR